MDAIVFSVWLPSIERQSYLEDYFKIMIEQHFVDCHIYIGVNPSPVQERAIEICRSFQTRFSYMEIGTVTPENAVTSDVSGYQKALQLMGKKRYRLVWFAHTRGISHDSKYPLYGGRDSPYVYDQGHALKFFSNRSLVSKRLVKCKKAGVWGISAIVIEQGISRPNVDQYYHFKYPLLPVFIYTTFFVMKGKPLHKFLSGCEPRFFTTNLGRSSPASRWLFEFYFGHIAYGQGYYPIYDRINTFPLPNSMLNLTGEDIDYLLKNRKKGIDPEQSVKLLRQIYDDRQKAHTLKRHERRHGHRREHQKQ
jgi:hypothetical protein